MDNAIPAVAVRRPFWQWIFCEPDGTPSFARIASGLALCFALGWTTVLVRHNHAFPELGGVVFLVSALYGINKVTAKRD